MQKNPFQWNEFQWIFLDPLEFAERTLSTYSEERHSCHFHELSIQVALEYHLFCTGFHFTIERH